MAQHATVNNPFMMMINPEVVLAAVERLDRLESLNRQLCRPLDRPTPGTAPSQDNMVGDDDDAADAVS